MLGAPAGVKVYSSVFAVSPEAAAEIIRRFVTVSPGCPVLENIDRERVGAEPRRRGRVLQSERVGLDDDRILVPFDVELRDWLVAIPDELCRSVFEGAVGIVLQANQARRQDRKSEVLTRDDGPAWPAERPRPARLFPRPEPVEATALLPDHPPVLFRWRSALHRVHRAEGPERILPEWWRPETDGAPWLDAPRDYYRVEDEGGRRFWLFREGLPGRGPTRWYLHGEFA